MTVFTKTAVDVFAAQDASGAARKVSNHEVQVWGTEVERALAAFQAGGGVIFQSKAQADANLGYDANTMAWVFDDDPSLAGIYQKQGASGSGSWQRVGDLPYSFIRATNTNSGNPNAITADTAVPIPAADGGALIVLNILADITGQSTVSFNGGPALSIKGANGAAVKPGDLRNGMVVAGFKVGNDFRLINTFGAQFLVATNTGGTNAITATTPTGVPEGDAEALIALPIVADNTGSPVTVSFNGGPALTVKTISGNDVPIAALAAGMIVWGFKQGDEFRLVTDLSSAGILAGAEAAAEEAEDAASRAQSYSAMLSADKVKFATVADLLADETMSYTPGEGLIEVGPGDIIEAQGFRYEVRDPGNDDTRFLVHTEGGIVLRPLADEKGVVNIIACGAAADGVTDDGPALRIAVETIRERGGGSLYLPAGMYYLKSGDPRGANFPYVSGDGFWAVCALPKSMSVYGDGPEATHIIVESSRLGARIHDGKVDVGAIFSNVRALDSSDVGHQVDYFSARDFTLSYTEKSILAEHVEGQFLRIYWTTPTPNGVVILDNITIKNAIGHHVFMAHKTEFFSMSNVRSYGAGRAADDENSDYSFTTVTGKIAVIDNCKFVGLPADFNTTFLEIGTQSAFIVNNKMEGGTTFLNAVSQELHPGPEYDNSVFLVHGNEASSISRFVAAWCFDANRIAFLGIENNKVSLHAETNGVRQQIVVCATYEGIELGDILPVTKCKVSNNEITATYGYSGEVVTGSHTGALIDSQFIEELHISDNTVSDIPRAITYLSGVKLKKALIARNTGTVAARANSGSGTNSLSRCAVAVVPGPDSIIQDVIIEDNSFHVVYPGGATKYGLRVENYHGDSLQCNITIKGNSFGGDVQEISIFNGTGSSFGEDTIHIDHDYRFFSASDSYVALVDAGQGATSVKAGSVGRYLGVESKCVDAGSKAIIIEAYGSSAPASRYWPIGSMVRNTNPTTHVGWVCTASGSPGTWQTFGSLGGA